jgi:arabinose-5-phosphate isomerase
VLTDEAEAIRRAADALVADRGPDFARAVDLVQQSTGSGGTVLVSGLGKSGLIGQKIAATMASPGHPRPRGPPPPRPPTATWGASGRRTSRSASATRARPRRSSPSPRSSSRTGCRSSRSPRARPGRATPPSALERLADATLAELVDDEAAKDYEGHALVAPTSSTTVTLALGDALALAVARRRSFTDADFRRRHPGGQLGGLLRPVTELLRFRVGDNLPLIEPGETVAAALDHAATMKRRPGAILVVEPGSGALAGIFTDGDLRRLVRRDRAALDRPIGEAMTASPRSLPESAIARDAVNMVREHRQDEIPVVDAEGCPVGLLDVQDLIAMKLVKD